MFECDDVSHKSAQPFRVQEIQLTQLGLQITVMEDHSTLMEKLDSLMKLRFVHLKTQFVFFYEVTKTALS